MKPTKEQEQEFWELCGVKISLWFGHYPNGEMFQYMGDEYGERIDIDLNSLIKYAVPKLSAGSLLWYGQGKGYGAVLNCPHIEVDDKDPADALFWICFRALGGKE